MSFILNKVSVQKQQCYYEDKPIMEVFFERVTRYFRTKMTEWKDTLNVIHCSNYHISLCAYFWRSVEVWIIFHIITRLYQKAVYNQCATVYTEGIVACHLPRAPSYGGVRHDPKWLRTFLVDSLTALCTPRHCLRYTSLRSGELESLF